MGSAAKTWDAGADTDGDGGADADPWATFDG